MWILREAEQTWALTDIMKFKVHESSICICTEQEDIFLQSNSYQWAFHEHRAKFSEAEKPLFYVHM
jgi:hypothetical protein